MVRDSANDIDLQSATIAVYNEKDSTLLGYRLTNGLGEFHITGLPVGISLKVVASFIGYQSRSVTFKISPGGLSNLKPVYLQRSDRQLKEVTVLAHPPVRMNGDTLEFFSDAFSLYENAVVEDLLTKLPGVTVWGDGTITINGRKVNQVLVNGKPFFGGNTNVAIKNIPKDAVEKVQVYQQQGQSGITQDSLTNVNIQLKKHKSAGFFGKLAAGYGTRERYEADANMNIFSTRSELGIVAGLNNVNKIAGNVSDLIENSVYKSTGVSMDYQPDFSMQGTNRPLSGGVIFRHDFISNPNAYNNNRLTATYFLRDNTLLNLRETSTITLLGGDSIQLKDNNRHAKQSGTIQDLSIRYDKKKDFKSYFISTKINSRQDRNFYSEVQNNFLNDTSKLTSISNKEEEVDSNIRKFSLETGFNKSKPSLKPADIDLKYSLSIDSDRNSRSRVNDFFSLDDPAENRNFNRLYQRRGNDMSHQLWASFGDLLKWIPADRNFMPGLSLKIQNSLSIDTRNERNIVHDIHPQDGNLVLNRNLTNNISTLLLNEQPALLLVKHFSRSLPDRYSKDWVISLNLQTQYYHQRSRSDQAFQNITRSYQKGTPGIFLNYSNFQVGEFRDNFKLGFKLSSEYPTIEQLAGLVDSSDQYFIRQPNRALRETERKEIKFSFQHSSLRSRNSLGYEFDIRAGVLDNAFSDSILIDNLGRGTYFTTNMDGNSYLNANGKLTMALKLTDHQIQFAPSAGIELSKSPSYINNERNFSRNRTGRFGLMINYTLMDKLAVYLENGVTLYTSRQEGANGNLFRNSNQFNRLAVSTNVTRKLFLGSNITVNRSTTSSFSPFTFTLWNTNIAYRFMKSDNLEVKCSALDLLRQNRSIINYGNNIMLTRGTANVLQQYFIVTVSYFPRKFGKNGN
ncbi:TonB-dependent receptor [Chitinophaga sp. XS-30]|uniref:TonB-dependent receptor n=1 Tax=Chitinophaga sp. XS-30 TaxID=2604421 RepID=UPI0011DCBC14|nr:TonB-dependent receptor [Chitinophaga sp. XS-30]QEH39723.1 TonB-dependent receptor [Chitinophaga sp. XS-30]